MSNPAAETSSAGEGEGESKVKCVGGIVSRLLCRPPRPSKDTVLSYYLPALGTTSYLAFSSHILKPDLLERFFPDNSHIVANTLLCNAHLGVGLYIFTRPHITAAGPVHRRIIYSLYGALLFNFGSALLWAFSKTLLPKCGYAKLVFGVGSGILLVLVGGDYLSYVDRKAVGNQ